MAFMRQGYRFVSNECERLNTDVFATRLLMPKTICMRGADAARLFYDDERFQRSGACPIRVVKTLFGSGGVQGLDGETHRHRKAMLMSVLSESKINRLVATVEDNLDEAAHVWQQADEIEVLSALHELLCRAACAWAGLQLDEKSAKSVSHNLATMIDGSGGVGIRHWKARRARKRMNRWATGAIRKVRRGDNLPPSSSPLMLIAVHRNLEGKLLDASIAGVEVLNIIRPIVAVARWVMFGVRSLHCHPDAASKLQEDYTYEAIDRFADEVRRFYPFFPAVAAKTKCGFVWNGLKFPANTRVLLDLYGTNHHPELWNDPESFNPDRFRASIDQEFTFIPHGGGDYLSGHRCAGEQATRRLLSSCLNFFVKKIAYEVPAQDLTVALNRFPTRPKSKMRISRVRLVAA